MNDETLKEVSVLMRSQDNRSTQHPLFVVQELKEIVKASGCGDRTIYVDGEDELSQEEYDAEEANEDSDVDLSEYREIEVSDEWVISDTAGMFFTEDACERHIKLNNYHYRKPRSYVISAWRNPEMVMVMQAILKLTGEEIPSHYK